MKLLCAYYTHKPGGFCKRLYRLMNALATRGHEVHYCCLDKAPPALSNAVHQHKIFFPLSGRSGLLFWVLFTAWCPIYLAAMSLKVRPDAFFAFGAYYGGMLRLSRLVHRRPLTLFLRSLVFRVDEINDKPQSLRLISNFVDRIGIASASLVVCMTKTMQQELEHFFKLRLQSVAILPNDAPTPPQDRERTDESSLGIFEQLNEKLASSKLVVLTSGVIDRRKNIEYLINVFEKMGSSGEASSATLLVAGDGPLLNTFLQEVKRRGIHNIEFLGWCDSLDALYPFVDVVVHPALHEGVPNSVLEALSAGIPVLCSDTPEMREVLGSADLFFDSKDVESLRARLQSILDAPTENLGLLTQASSAVTERLRFDWDSRACDLILKRH